MLMKVTAPNNPTVRLTNFHVSLHFLQYSANTTQFTNRGHQVMHDRSKQSHLYFQTTLMKPDCRHVFLGDNMEFPLVQALIFFTFRTPLTYSHIIIILLFW